MGGWNGRLEWEVGMGGWNGRLEWEVGTGVGSGAGGISNLKSKISNLKFKKHPPILAC